MPLLKVASMQGQLSAVTPTPAAIAASALAPSSTCPAASTTTMPTEGTLDTDGKQDFAAGPLDYDGKQYFAAGAFHTEGKQDFAEDPLDPVADDGDGELSPTFEDMPSDLSD